MKSKSKAFYISLLINIILSFSLIVVFVKGSDKVERILHRGSCNIVMFGDSQTYFGEWDKLLDRSDIINSGTRGFTTSQLIWGIGDKVIDYRPKICFIEGGINDIITGIPIERSKSNIKQIVVICRKYHVTPVIQPILYTTDPVKNIAVDSLNSFLMGYCKSEGLDYIDINQVLSENHFLKAEFSKDGVHLKGDAYNLWAAVIKDYLSKKGI